MENEHDHDAHQPESEYVVPQDYIVLNCWASCDCTFDQPISLVFDIYDRRTGITFKNVKGECYGNNVTFDLGVDTPPDNRPTDLNNIKSFVTFDDAPSEKFKETISADAMEWCKTLFVASENQALMIPDFDEFSADFNPDPDDEDCEDCGEGELAAPEGES